MYFSRLDHWDVNNELLHGQLYEEMTRDQTYTQEIFRAVHAHDPKPKLFLNDYNVVAGGAVTDVRCIRSHIFHTFYRNIDIFRT